MVKSLIERLKDEKEYSIKGGVYNKIQVDFAYNSSHMEGSRLTHEQTRYIFETHSIDSEPARIDDIIETVNHFRCFDYILDTYEEELSEEYIKHLHYLLKNNTYSAQAKEAVIGDYKKYPNMVGDIKTASPKQVEKQLSELIKTYNNDDNVDLDVIIKFHSDYEKIHPFYDGNGRTGRLIMFKECLKHNIVPFIIDDRYKAEYNRGLYEWQTNKEYGYLRDTCLFMQDHMYEIMDYFELTKEESNEDKTIGGDDYDPKTDD